MTKSSSGRVKGSFGAPLERSMAGGLLLVLGIAMLLGVVGLMGMYPSGITGPYAVALGGMAVVPFVLARWSLAPGAAAEGPVSAMARLAATIGGLSVLSIAFLLFGNADVGADHTLPASVRLAPLALGSAALVLGLVARRGANERTRRACTSAAVMGAVSALVPQYLWSFACHLFVSGCT